MAQSFRMLSGGITSSIEQYLDEYTAAAKRIQPLMPEGWVMTSAGPGIHFGNPNGPGGQSFTNEVIRSMLAYLDAH